MYVHIHIMGRVQGVFFRATAKDLAVSLGLRGWVRNNNDGSVSVEAAGEDDNVEKFINWCRTGPARASVERIEVQYKKSSHFTGFEIVRS